jgi:hypothetical protein
MKKRPKTAIYLFPKPISPPKPFFQRGNGGGWVAQRFAENLCFIGQICVLYVFLYVFMSFFFFSKNFKKPIFQRKKNLKKTQKKPQKSLKKPQKTSKKRQKASKKRQKSHKTRRFSRVPWSDRVPISRNRSRATGAAPSHCYCHCH